jgi:predicted nucleic acid-binding protein
VTALKAYLDSTFLISYLWWLKATPPPAGREVAALARAIEAKAFDPVISRFSLMEVADHFSDYQFLLLLIRDGYGYREFSRRKKHYALPSDAENKVKEPVRELETSPLLSVVTIERWGAKAFSDIETLARGYVGIVDVIHLQVATDVKCDYLVTGDEDFRRRVGDLASAGTIDIPTKVVSPKQFLQLGEIRKALRSSDRGSN